MLNLIDTPGFIDFAGEIRAALSVADAALILVDPVAGVEVGTELGWGYADDRGLPRAVFVNKMDRENAHFERVLRNLREVFDRTIVAAQLPIGEGSEFQGVVDLITMKAYVGEAWTPSDVPADLVDVANESHNGEAAAGRHDLMKYRVRGSQPGSRAAANRDCEGNVIPVFCVQQQQCGVRLLLDGLVSYMPSPVDVPQMIAEA
jgi:elongation factor G